MERYLNLWAAISVEPGGLQKFGARRWLRAAVSLGVLACAGLLLSNVLRDVQVNAVWAAVGVTAPVALLLATGFTAVSFSAIAAYDVLSARVLNSPLPPMQALRSGFVATAIGQVTGFGLVVCSYLRWRMGRVYGVTPVLAAQTTGVVSLGFMICAGVILGGFLCVQPGPVATMAGLSLQQARGLGLMLLGVGVATYAICWVQPGRLALPPVQSVRQFMLVTLVDILPAAATLWVLLPQGAAVPFVDLLPVFLGAYLFGLVSGTPGGAGMLEVACLLAFPAVSPEAMLAALLMFRAIYYLLPLIIAAGLWGAEEAQGRRGTAERRQRPRPVDVLPPNGIGIAPCDAEPMLASSARAEVGLVYLGEASILAEPGRHCGWMIARGANALVALGDPMGPLGAAGPSHFHRLEDEARARALSPVVYRAGPDTARAARLAGWWVTQHGAEAIVDTARFSLDGRARAGLRRKLRKANAALQITHYRPGKAPLTALREVSDEWLRTKRGREQQFALGRFDPAYLARFDILTADAGQGPIAFVSLWRSGDGAEWSIDLIRGRAEMPTGTMQALVVEGISLAKRAGARRFSLCAVPCAGIEAPQHLGEGIAATLWSRIGAQMGWHGLHQFKAGFDPIWEPRYAAVPHWTAVPTACRGVRKLIG